jgi:hypothetical protein
MIFIDCAVFLRPVDDWNDDQSSGFARQIPHDTACTFGFGPMPTARKIERPDRYISTNQSPILCIDDSGVDRLDVAHATNEGASGHRYRQEDGTVWETRWGHFKNYVPMTEWSAASYCRLGRA